MSSHVKKLLLGLTLSLSFLAMQAQAQFAYESSRMGNDYKVFIYKRYNLGDGKWSFKQRQSSSVEQLHCLGVRQASRMFLNGGS